MSYCSYYIGHLCHRIQQPNKEATVNCLKFYDLGVMQSLHDTVYNSILRDTHRKAKSLQVILYGPYFVVEKYWSVKWDSEMNLTCSQDSRDDKNWESLFVASRLVQLPSSCQPEGTHIPQSSIPSVQSSSQCCQVHIERQLQSYEISMLANTMTR